MGLRNRTQLRDFHLSFVTTTCHNFLPLIEPEAVKQILIESLKFCNHKYHAAIVAYALMPEHLHLLLYFKEETMLIEYMRDFKKFTSVQIKRYWQKESPEVLNQLIHVDKRQKYKVWMERFDDVILYSPKVCYTKLNYVNNNPRKRGLCASSEDYEYCSAKFYAGKEDDKIELVHLCELL